MIKKNKIMKESKKYENNMKYFEFQDKYKKISSNVIDIIKKSKNDD